jgi:hypothetical protein
VSGINKYPEVFNKGGEEWKGKGEKRGNGKGNISR